MTDNEIIKAWEKILAMGDAPIGEHWAVGGVVTTKLAIETLDMLNRQNAEIERYLHSIKLLEKDVQTANAEIERLKFRKCLYSGLYSEYDIKQIRDCTQGECFHRESEELVRIEAIKEFANEYKDHIKNFTGMFSPQIGFCVNLDAILFAVDFVREKMTKEMVGDDNA